ncbi:MAG: DUF2799 domain-containing protein [Psychrobacter sp.]|uniref:DUF2799 domain-containing protein n=1 Tax=unclassified Psychrobacter TaxID=196806 RepID=UPI001787B616|nr:MULTISPECIES: DUF2799 domain-containing protein [unclassified Psychrobacter]MBE0443275.1 DUF2799 domain-containing protein [Psychrobacter sp. FME13]
MQQLVRRLSLSLSIFGSIFLLSSCATLSKQECLIGDWQAIGYNDGISGYQSDRLASHAKACAKASVTPNYQAWERGRQLGLKQYCMTDNAYNLGRRGRKLNNVCPAAITSTLQQANQQGLDQYHLEQQLESDQRLLKEYREEFDRLKSGEMLEFDNEKEARRRLLSLANELRQTRHRINTAQTQLDLLEQMNSYGFN